VGQGIAIHKSVRPLPNETLVIKHFPKGFRETALLEHLKKTDVKDVVICGAMNHMCVDATASAAFDLHPHCLLAEDACATRVQSYNGQIIEVEKVHGALMTTLSCVYARVISSKEYLKQVALL